MAREANVSMDTFTIEIDGMISIMILEQLTNRAGTINEGIQDQIDINKKCYYPTYQFLIDWDNDILCPQDWQRRVSMGNMMQETIFKIWTGRILTKFRKDLLSA